MEWRIQGQDFDAEPTFEEFEAARKVVIYVRRMLAAERNGKGACTPGRDPLALADSPIMAEIIMRSSPVCNPALWEQSQLASAEGDYDRDPQYTPERSGSGKMAWQTRRRNEAARAAAEQA